MLQGTTIPSMLSRKTTVTMILCLYQLHLSIIIKQFNKLLEHRIIYDLIEDFRRPKC